MGIILNIIQKFKKGETLDAFLDSMDAGAGSGLRKYFVGYCGHIPRWDELNATFLTGFKSYLLDNIAQSSARTYCAVLRAEIGKRKEVPQCRDYAEILTIPDAKSEKVWLTLDELGALSKLVVNNANEKLILAKFLLCAYTGYKLSNIQDLVSLDSARLNLIDIIDEKYSYEESIRNRITEYIEYVQDNHKELPLTTINRIIRKLCYKAGVTDKIIVFKAGQQTSGEKWQYVSSNTARISFATNMSMLGVPLQTIMNLMGHTNPNITLGYCLDNGAIMREQENKVGLAPKVSVIKLTDNDEFANNLFE